MDGICVKILSNNFDEDLVNLLSDLAKISGKNKISQYAARKMLSVDYLMNILLFIVNFKDDKEWEEREAEIMMIFEILYKGK